jgi:hypothetical protein
LHIEQRDSIEKGEKREIRDERNIITFHVRSFESKEFGARNSSSTLTLTSAFNSKKRKE